MRIAEVKLFSFEELSQEAKEKALENFRNEERELFWMEENMESLKKSLEHFDFKLTDWSFDYYYASRGYLKIECCIYDEDKEIEDLEGESLLNWLKENGYFSHYNYHFKKTYNVLDGECPFTGYCMDENFLEAIREFVKNPEGITLQELMEKGARNILKGIEEDYEYQNSLEFLKDESESKRLGIYRKWGKMVKSGKPPNFKKTRKNQKSEIMENVLNADQRLFLVKFAWTSTGGQIICSQHQLAAAIKKHDPQRGIEHIKEFSPVKESFKRIGKKKNLRILYY